MHFCKIESKSSMRSLELLGYILRVFYELRRGIIVTELEVSKETNNVQIVVGLCFLINLVYQTNCLAIFYVSSIFNKLHHVSV